MEKKVVVKIKKASFYKAFGKSLNLMRPVGEFTEEEVGKLSDDIKRGLIEIIGEEPVKVDVSKETEKELAKEQAEITEDKKEEETVEKDQPVEEIKTEESVEKETKTRGRKAI